MKDFPVLEDSFALDDDTLRSLAPPLNKVWERVDAAAGGGAGATATGETRAIDAAIRRCSCFIVTEKHSIDRPEGMAEEESIANVRMAVGPLKQKSKITPRKRFPACCLRGFVV